MKTLSLAAALAALLHVAAGTSLAQIGFPHSAYGNPTGHGGTMLGIYAAESIHGLRVMGTVDGCSAHGRLLPNDVLLRATADNLPVFSINTHDRMEYAKMMIGANRCAAIEFFRPGVGHMYAWMTFELKCNDTHSMVMGITSASHSTFTAQFVLEAEKPGAQALFGTPAAAAAPLAAPQATPGAGSAAAPAPNAAPPVDAAPGQPLQPQQPALPQQPAQPQQPALPQQPTDSASTEAAIDALLK